MVEVGHEVLGRKVPAHGFWGPRFGQTGCSRGLSAFEGLVVSGLVQSETKRKPILLGGPSGRVSWSRFVQLTAGGGLALCAWIERAAVCSGRAFASFCIGPVWPWSLHDPLRIGP